MESVPMYELGYLLFIVPGFVVVWTYRHFTRAKEINGFEYAVWSFIWGVLLFIALMFFIRKWGSLPDTPIHNIFQFMAGVLGISLAFMVGALALGYLGAFIAKLGFFRWIDKWLFTIIERYPKS